MHARIGLACSRALGISLCVPSPLGPPLIVHGIVVGLCSVPPWHSMVATPCRVPLPFLLCVIGFDALQIPPFPLNFAFSTAWTHCAQSFSVTPVGSGHQARASVVDLWIQDVCSDCFSLFPAAQVCARTRVRQSCSIKSRTLRSSIAKYSMLARPRHTSRYQ